jgi:hypothetical protein
MSENIAPTVGMILESQWGYDQTNIDFYKIVRVTKTMVELQPWSVTRVEQTGYDSYKVQPGDYPAETHSPVYEDAPSGEWRDRIRVRVDVSVMPTIRKKWQPRMGGVSLNSYAIARIWEGDDLYMSSGR